MMNVRDALAVGGVARARSGGFRAMQDASPVAGGRETLAPLAGFFAQVRVADALAMIAAFDFQSLTSPDREYSNPMEYYQTGKAKYPMDEYFEF
jgi:hypothetical protein